MSDLPDFEYAPINGTIASVNQKALGAKGGLVLGHRAIARRPDPRQADNRAPIDEKGTKIVALLDALGNLVRFVLFLDPSHDVNGIPPLIDRRLYLPKAWAGDPWQRAKVHVPEGDMFGSIVSPRDFANRSKEDCT